jgi:hypothetical protein
MSSPEFRRYRSRRYPHSLSQPEAASSVFHLANVSRGSNRFIAKD